MKVFILLLFGLLCKAADITTCNCSQLTTEYDCGLAIANQRMTQDMYDLKVCMWNEGTCIDLFDYESKTDCATIVDEAFCTFAPFCAWFNGQCSKFKKCSDYTFESSQLSTQCYNLYCLDNGSTCAFDLIGRTEQTCEELNTQDVCESIYILYKSTLCKWSDSACKGQVLSSCNSLNQQQCNQASAQCGWNGTTCQKRTCSLGGFEFGKTSGTKVCSSYVDIESKNVVHCNLNSNGVCLEQDPSEYDRRNCYAQSFSQYRWMAGNKSCEKC